MYFLSTVEFTVDVLVAILFKVFAVCGIFAPLIRYKWTIFGPYQLVRVGHGIVGPRDAVLTVIADSESCRFSLSAENSLPSSSLLISHSLRFISKPG